MDLASDLVKNTMIKHRLHELSKLERGWIDGDLGKPIKRQMIKWLEIQFDVHYNNSLPEPYLFPMEDGEISAEWDFKYASIEVIFDYENHCGYLYVWDKQNNIDYPIQKLSFENGGWKILVDLISQEWLKS